VSKGCRQTDNFAALPNRVRHDEIQEPAFFGRLLLFKQPVHVSREFEQLDAGLSICCPSAESFDPGEETGLLLPVLGGFAFKQRNANAAA
jgi:hypothetical protein